MVIDKAEFIKSLADAGSMSLARAEASLNAMLVLVTDRLANGDTIRFKGFGVFTVKTHMARNGRNVRTGEAIVVPARTAVRFKPSTTLKAAVAALPADA